MSATPQRERELPSLARRAAAGLVDAMLGFGFALGLIGLGAVSFERWTAPDDLLWIEHVAATFHRSAAWTFWQWMLLWLPFCCLHAVAGTLQRRTPGAALLGLCVVGPDGHRASAVRGLLRGVAYATWPLTLGLAPLLVAIGPSQRGPHDLLSATWVVRDPAALSAQKARP